EVRETTEVRASSLAKGESLYDTARVLSGYSDVIVMRHPEAGSVAEFAEASRVPVINAGDGTNEHPSQALLDLYTIRKEMESRGRGIDTLRIALVGDLKYGRAVHSLCKMLSLFDRVHYKLVSPPELAAPPEIISELKAAGHEVEEHHELETGIDHVDILYVTRTQEERFPTQAEADRYRGLFRVNQSIYTKNCEPNTVIMHPLPRDSRAQAQELDDDLILNPNLAIFRQTDNGVLIRMALFSLVLDVAGEVHNHAQPVTWYTAKRFG
ncbi:MAG: aspartate carbamoyltransferase, partial [Pseudomonadales bacterium]